MKESTLTNLVGLTKEFFAKHWNASLIGKEAPEWCEPQEIRYGNPLPNHNKQGCYAFVDGEKVVYIGVGTSRGGGRYRGHGIGKRFQAYAKYVNGVYQIVDERFKRCKAVTIGFEVEEAYLANALELFLIGHMPTNHNKNAPGS